MTGSIKTDCLGRITISPEHREALLDEFERSNMKGVPFAHLHGINYQTFASWIQKRRRERGDYDQTSAPVKSEQIVESRSEPKITLAELSLPEETSRMTQDSEKGLTLILPNDIRVEVHHPNQISLLKELLSTLQSRSSC